MALYRISDGSDAYSRDIFKYPSGVILRPTGEIVTQNGLQFERLEVAAGEIRTLDGRVARDLTFRVRHVGGSIHTGDSIVLYATVGGTQLNVGWFAVEPI